MKRKFIVEVDGNIDWWHRCKKHFGKFTEGGRIPTSEDVLQCLSGASSFRQSYDKIPKITVKPYREKKFVECSNCGYAEYEFKHGSPYCRRIERSVPVELQGCGKGKRG